MKSISYGRQEITDSDIEHVVEALKGDFLTQGPSVSNFEEKFAEYVGSKYAVAVSNGTAALHLSVLALGIKAGDKVITTPNTFAASANCIRYAGGEVVFCDIDPETFLLDPIKVEALIEKHPKGTFTGIIPVDFAGYPVDMEAYRQIAEKHDLWILEDACHAPGAERKNNYRSGNGLADASIFSFHPVKHIATGEGGMITTNRKEVYDSLCRLRTHGITKDPDLMEENHGGWYYEMVELGYNYRLTDIQAALGISQLERADVNIQKRRRIANTYNAAFSETNIAIPQVENNVGHAYHLYVIRVDDRLGLYNHLKANNIFAQVHYIPVHTLPFYKSLGWKKGDMPFAEAYYGQCISLPMYPSLTAEEQAYVIDQVLGFVNNGN